MGRKGRGKTTLFKTRMGILPRRHGSSMVDGRELAGMESYQRVASGVAYVPQGRMIFSTRTVKENIETGLVVSGGSEVPEDIYELFPVLLEMKGRRGGNLSGGQQQQLAIARALATKPKVLLLDEPTEGIQPSIIKDIDRAIRSLVAAGDIAVLLVEQYYDFAKSLADHYVVLSRGEVVAQGLGANMDRDNVRAHLAV